MQLPSVFVASLSADERRTFCNDDDVGSFASTAEFPKVAEWEYVVKEVRAVVFGEDDIDIRTEAAMLVNVVKQDNLGRAGAVHQFLYAKYTVFADGDGQVWKTACHHCRFVADGLGIVCFRDKSEPFGLASVTTAQQCYSLVGQKSDKVFCMWGFARSAHAEVTHADSESVKPLNCFF